MPAPPVLHRTRMTAQQRAVLDVLHRSDRFRSALVVVLIGKWLQPSRFTHNVQRTQRIVGGQYGLVPLTRSFSVELPGIEPALKICLTSGNT